MSPTPDVVGEIVAYRTWRIHLGSVLEGPELLSLNGTYWPKDNWLEATCNRGTTGCTETPGEQCTCGVYAAKERAHLFSIGYHGHNGQTIMGSVALAGKVIPGTMGWRAQKARILHIVVPFTEWKMAAQLAEAYGVTASLHNPYSRREPEWT